MRVALLEAIDRRPTPSPRRWPGRARRLTGWSRSGSRATTSWRSPLTTASARGSSSASPPTGARRSTRSTPWAALSSASATQGFDVSYLRGTNDAALTQAYHSAVENGAVWEVDSGVRFGDTKISTDIHRMLDEFRRADCVIESVDVRGLAPEADQAPAFPGGKESLLLLARDTGGELFENTNDMNVAMGALLARTSLTYVLSFQPENVPADGQYRTIRVKVRNDRGLRVTYRPGYYAPRPFAQRSALERRFAAAGLVLGGVTGGRIPMSVLAAPFPVPGGRPYVPVVVEIDGKALLAGSAGGTAQVEVYAYALDEQGAIHDRFAQSLGLDLGKVGGQLGRGGIKYYGHLDLDPGRYVVRVLVRNGQSGEVGLASAPLTVPAYEQGEAGGLDRLRASFRPGNLPAGSYTLIVKLSDGATKRELASSIPFVVAAPSPAPAAR